MKYFKSSFDITRKDFTKTNSAKFKGKIDFVFNEFGIIKGYNLEFSEVWVDLYTTARWFRDKPAIFKYRESLFKLIGLIQEVRPKSSSNKVIKLDNHQLEKLNYFFNEVYSSTLKNVVGVLKGNNPGGEAKNPRSAELIIDTKGFKQNFVILFDDLTDLKVNNFNLWAIGAELVPFEDFINIRSDIKDAYLFMQLSKKEIEFKIYLNNIKKYVDKYKYDLSQIEKLISKYRLQYSKNIDSIQKLPFGFNDKSQFQKAHIYEVKAIKENIYEDIKNGINLEDAIKKYVNIISDKNNFLPLEESWHRQFDKGNITWEHTTGKLIANNQYGQMFIENNKTDRYNLIDPFFFNQEISNYLRIRNKK